MMTTTDSPRMLFRSSAVLLMLLVLPATVFDPAMPAGGQILVDDFEADRAGRTPAKWRFLDYKAQKYLALKNTDQEKFSVVSEGGNQFLRAYTHNAAQRISIPHDQLDWNTATHPNLSWRWRANRLPAGAREDKANDSGGAVYITFDRKDFLGRPHSIKYVYSTLLPAGKSVSFGNLKVLVVSSGTDGTGSWKRVQRNVVADYERLFDREAPAKPFTITIWSDSDDTGGTAEVDFDDITLRP